jgi:hypothetical protein
MPRNPWNDITVATLKSLWVLGLSCSQIAAKIPGATRNSVIGKANRLGLPGRVSGGKPSNPNAPRQRRVGVNRDSIKNRILNARLRAESARAKLTAHDAKITKEDVARKALVDLEDDDCRYVVGDDPRSVCFCALPKVEGTSYCLTHLLRCTQPIPVKSRPVPIPVRETEEA